MSRAVGDTSLVNGAILDRNESEEATTGHLQQADAIADDDDAAGPSPAVVQTSTAAAGGRLRRPGPWSASTVDRRRPTRTTDNRPPADTVSVIVDR